MRQLIVCILLWPTTGAPLHGQHAKQLPATTIGAFSISNYENWKREIGDSGIVSYFSDDSIQEMFRGIFESAPDKNWLMEMVRSGVVRNFAVGQITFAIVQEGGSQKFAVIIECRNDQQADLCVQEIRRLSAASANDFTTDNSSSTVFACTDASLLQRIMKPASGDLEATDNFRSTVAKASKEIKDPHFWLFVDPFAILKTVESSGDSDESFSRSLQLANTEGFDAVKAVGGCGILRADDAPLQFVGHILAKQPFRRGMRIMAFTNSKISDPPNWLRGKSSSGFFHLNLESILDSFSTLFDEIAGEGEDGVFEVVLDDLKSDPNGPKVNVQIDILENLEPPFYFTTDRSASNDNGANQTVIGIRSRDDKKLANALARFYDGDPQAEKIDAPSFSAWKVKPIVETDTGIRSTYVVAVRNGYLLTAPNIEAIDFAFKNESNVSGWEIRNDHRLSKAEASFGYQLNFSIAVETTHNQLKYAALDGLLGQLAKRMNLTDAIKNADRAKWPEFSTVSKYFDSRIILLGNSNAQGWKFVVETVK